ncbi:transglycosylase domain-containing protein [bacterium]|nr:transglycosylase domain-containing protein [bacterium]
MRSVQDQIEQTIHTQTRHRRVHVDRPSGWVVMLRGTIVTSALLLFLFLVTAGQVLYFAFDDPSRTPLMRANHQAAKRSGLDQDIYQVWVPLELVPKSLQNAVLIAEDEEFFFHNGFKKVDREERAWPGTIVSAWRQQRSSLTNVLVRNLMLGRKHDDAIYIMRERLLTHMFEAFLSKDRILELYLNTVHIGPGVYGVEQGARHHFGLSASRLTLEQSCRLAVVIESPIRLRIYQDRVTSRAAQLAQRMGVSSSLPIATLGGASDPTSRVVKSM